MRYDLSNKIGIELAYRKLDDLKEHGKKVEINAVSQKRGLAQNSYYHVMLQYFATQAGCTLEEAKQLIRLLQTELYQTTTKVIGGVEVTKSRSSADFTSAEMAKSIDDFRKWASEVPMIPIPAPNETELLAYMDEVIAQNKAYL